MRSDLIAQINPDALMHNVDALRANCAPRVRLCAPLKADAYGHGLRVVAPILQSVGVDFAIVATVVEAIELRHLNWRGEILLLGNVLAVRDETERSDRIDAIIEHELAVTITDANAIDHLEKTRPVRPIPVHLKIDTGMGRMGVLPGDAPPLVERINKSRAIRLAGIYSHFATADFQLTEIADHQQSAFQTLVKSLRPQLPSDCIVHLANSAATITRPDAHYDMVRPGLALYGYAPAGYMREQIELRPILRLVSHLSAIKTLPPNHCVGYGQTFTTKRETRLGIVPLGYFDGFLRRLSNNAVVGTPHGPAPVVGRISMDQLAVDLTDLPSLSLGDEITLIDPDPNAENSVESLARRLETIPYEVTCCLGARIDRIVMRTASARVESAPKVRKSVGL